jgi:dihydroflavonol-4-reductase
MAEGLLATCGSGFLAGWQIVALLRAGYEERATVGDPAGADEVSIAVAREVDPAGRLDCLSVDLTRDDNWDQAGLGCRYVLIAQPTNPDDLVIPARDGTLRVLRAAVAAKVDRVVMTSSSSALSDPPSRRPIPITGAHWSDPDRRGPTPYVQSKVLLERAAWDFMRKCGGRTGFRRRADDHRGSAESTARMTSRMTRYADRTSGSKSCSSENAARREPASPVPNA